MTISRNKELNCYQYPSTVLFVDDDRQFLKNSILGLDSSSLYQFSDKPQKVVDILNQNKLSIINNEKLLKSIDLESEDDLAVQYAISLELSPIWRQVCNACRFNHISVLIVDYVMPAMDGITLCENLKNHPVKKLMITGKADYALAVDAFNEGIIDQFILKDDIDFFERLNAAVSKLQNLYFKDLSSVIWGNLSTLPSFCLADPPVIDIILAYLDEHRIVEYYLLDGSGSYLMIDNEGHKTIFSIKSQREMQDHYQVAIDNNAPIAITNALKDSKNMLFLLGERAYAAPVEEWSHYIYPAQALQGRTGLYYYSVISEIEPYFDNSQKAYFWNQHAETL